MKDGILVLNKPKEWTSHDCVAVCRRVLGIKGVKKIGHGGTLDPMAEGVLPIFVGQATRTMEYLDYDYKTYECTARLGITTDTQDIWGQVISEKKPGRFSYEEINSALDSFRGRIQQIPPAYSAVRVDGKRLYEYARSGRTVEVKPRRAFVGELELLSVLPEAGRLAFRVKCSKGTYIRTICSDLGELLGCGCAMDGLVRTAVGNISLKGSVSPEQVKTMSPEELEKMFIAPDFPLTMLGKVTIDRDRAVYFSRGNSIRWRQVRVVRPPEPDTQIRECMPVNARGREYSTLYKVYREDTGEFMGIGFYDEKEKELKADKIFTEKL